jgi:invasion protein IalB
MKLPRRRDPSVILVGFVCCLVAASARAETEPKAFRDWSLLLGSDGKSCLLAQTIRSKSSDTVLVQAILQASDSGSRLALRVPNGASLVSGIGYRVPTDNIIVPLDWVECSREFCLAQRTMTESEINALRRGRDIQVIYRPLPEAPSLAVPVSLLGFTAGMEALDQCAISSR